MNSKLLTTGVALTCFLTMAAEQYTVKSPDNRLSVTVNTGKATTYSVDFDGRRILDPSPTMTHSSPRRFPGTVRCEPCGIQGFSRALMCVEPVVGHSA